MRERLPVLAGAAAGLAAGIALTLLQASTYRADASIALVRQGQPPGNDPALAQAAEAAAELIHSRAVVEPSIANLRLDDSPEDVLDRFSVEAAPESSLLRLSVDAPSRDEARRTVQELTEVATVLFNDRYGPQTAAAVWEAPRADEDRVSPKPARNLALGALAGALFGQLLLLRKRRPPRPVVAVPPAREPVAAPVVVPELEPAPPPAPAPVARSAPAHEPVPGPSPPRRFAEPRLGEWTLVDVELLLAEQGPAFPDRLEELGFYLDSFRGVVAPDGRLPGGVEAIVEDVFEPLLARARTTSAS
jgi:capsular polysaccharide biosynthesis protein